MEPEVCAALNHIKDFVRFNAPIVHPKLDRSLGIIENALKGEE